MRTTAHLLQPTHSQPEQEIATMAEDNIDALVRTYLNHIPSSPSSSTSGVLQGTIFERLPSLFPPIEGYPSDNELYCAPSLPPFSNYSKRTRDGNVTEHSDDRKHLLENVVDDDKLSYILDVTTTVATDLPAVTTTVATDLPAVTTNVATTNIPIRYSKLNSNTPVVVTSFTTTTITPVLDPYESVGMDDDEEGVCETYTQIKLNGGRDYYLTPSTYKYLPIQRPAGDTSPYLYHGRCHGSSHIQNFTIDDEDFLSSRGEASIVTSTTTTTTWRDLSNSSRKRKRLVQSYSSPPLLSPQPSSSPSHPSLFFAVSSGPSCCCSLYSRQEILMVFCDITQNSVKLIRGRTKKYQGGRVDLKKICELYMLYSIPRTLMRLSRAPRVIETFMSNFQPNIIAHTRTICTTIDEDQCREIYHKMYKITTTAHAGSGCCSNELALVDLLECKALDWFSSCQLTLGTTAHLENIKKQQYNKQR
ncbi:hypothetical protein GE061_016764 [Apolygus lucorum]|uniref:Uncharacterized protein n=1 Tax=Apolygus lucorum TaxID=248454 RepID=A0A6A4K131_APOLU|nr:hypothetical protein GE061_016764 [Apolygus lucorum]